MTLRRPTVLLPMALLAVACERSTSERPVAVPEPDMTNMEPQVEQRLRETRSAVFANPQSASAWGRFGMVAHAHGLWEDALPAYRQAQTLDPILTEHLHAASITRLVVRYWRQETRGNAVALGASTNSFAPVGVDFTG